MQGFLKQGSGEAFAAEADGLEALAPHLRAPRVLGPGECFGEMAYLSLDRRERGATVTTSQDSHVVRIRIADLEKATVSCRSNVDRAFIGILVERLNLANTRLTSG